MADWKTYAKAARNTAKKQAPAVSRSARRTADRASRRAGDYARAAGKVVEENQRDEEDRRRGRDEEDEAPRGASGDERDEEDDERRPPRSGDDDEDDGPRPGLDTERWRRDAAAYATVAQRRVESANILPRVLRALRDALLIGLSLLAIWLVLSAAGIQIPFSAMLIGVVVIVVIAFGGTLFSQFRRQRQETDPPAGDTGT